MWIFHGFFVLKASGWKQLHLQTWYFWFLIFFVLLMAAIGPNLGQFMEKITTSPLSVFSLFASMLPVTTHFFMNFVLMQPVTHSMNLLRYVNLLKFLVFKQVCDEDRARELAEPEDQDYYGLGSRSARFTLVLVIGIVFGTICPLMNILVFFNMAFCRLVYGYLIPYAETRKNDLGGYHWASQLHHVQYGVLIYIVMMVGILWQRSESRGPAFVSAISFLWWYVSHRKFSRGLLWEKIALTTAVDCSRDNSFGKDRPGRPKRAMKYFQKELDAHEWDK